MGVCSQGLDFAASSSTGRRRLICSECSEAHCSRCGDTWHETGENCFESIQQNAAFHDSWVGGKVGGHPYRDPEAYSWRKKFVEYFGTPRMKELCGLVPAGTTLVGSELEAEWQLYCD